MNGLENDKYRANLSHLFIYLLNMRYMGKIQENFENLSVHNDVDSKSKPETRKTQTDESR